MRIAVMSPHVHGNGNTIVSILLAMQMAATSERVCLSHVMPLSEPFFKYLNFFGYEDRTSSPAQIVKLLKAGDVLDSDVSSYCRSITDNLEAFVNQHKDLTQNEMDFMRSYILAKFPHEHIVIDVDTNDVDRNRDTVMRSDVAVLVVGQSVAEMSRYRERAEEYNSVFKGKPVIVVVNKYNSVKATISETARWMGVKKPNNWLVLHDNPYIAWAANRGEVKKIFSKIAGKDRDMIELNYDLAKIEKALIKAHLSARAKKA